MSNRIKIHSNGIVIVDVSYVLNSYIKLDNLKRFFRFVPLKDIVLTVLSVSHYIDYSEPVYELLDKRTNLMPDEDVDYDSLLLLIESLVLDLDTAIEEVIEVEPEDYYIAEDLLEDGSLILEIKK